MKNKTQEYGGQKMKLEKSKNIMKTFAILLVVASSISVIVGIIVIAGSGLALGNIAGMSTVQSQVAATAFLTGGIGMIAACILSMTEGLASLVASKRIKKTEYKKDFEITKTTTKSADLKAA